MSSRARRTINFLRDDFHRGLAVLPDLDPRYDLLLFERQLPVAIRLVDRQADPGIVVDHIAKPEIRKGRISPAWKSGMAELAKRENIPGVKVSGMVTEVPDAEIDEATPHAHFETALELFGPDRLMFGTDWPVCLLRIEPCRHWVETVKRFVSSLSNDEQSAILTTNAARIHSL